jgi:hypothetical protein
MWLMNKIMRSILSKGLSTYLIRKYKDIMYKLRTFLTLSIMIILMVFLMSLSPFEEDSLRKVQIKESVNFKILSYIKIIKIEYSSQEVITLSHSYHERIISFESLMAVLTRILVK